MHVLPHNDQPISIPAEDRFGIDPFARALATSIRKLHAPLGPVLALNGPWGSGKSSAVNLVRHHLSDAVNADELAIIDFTCWWFRGEEALALAFFRELYAGLSPSLGDKIKKALPKLGARLLRAGSALGSAADAAGAGGAGAAAGGVLEWLSGLIEQDESVEALHRELSAALAGQKKRYLVVIDDIDRLSPDEALLIFRLVKSVGRLPNVLYLLVYDRLLAERIVSERYPSEGGPHYLEKIVQAAFELPEPTATDVQQHLSSLIEAICGTPKEADIVRFMNIFHEGVAPAMRTPRDVMRLANSLAVTWPVVGSEVNTADFLALEVLRLLHPSTYRAIRQNKDLMCHGARANGQNRDAVSKQYDDLLFGADAPPANSRLRRALMRLFPSLESAWSNMNYGDGFGRQWAMERRVCSATHFDSYFRFAIGDDVLTRAEIDEFVQRAADQDYVAKTLRHAVTVERKTGGTKAAVLLDEINTHAERIPKESVLALLTALFAIADEIDVEADAARGFSFGNNELRLHWLMRNLILDRTTLDERSALLLTACATASLGWLADLTRSAWNDYHPAEGKAPEPAERCLTTEVDAGSLRTMLLEKIEAAAKDGSLAKHRGLTFLLYCWLDLRGDSGAAARAWTAALCTTDDGVRTLAKACTSYGWTHGMGFAGLGDLVAKRVTHVQMKERASIIDIEAFRKRVEEVQMTGNAPELVEFLEAWRREEQGRRG